MSDLKAIVSDLHSNTEALYAVLDDIRRQGAKDILCLGDIVGYGPQPVECIDRSMSEFKFVLCGNHDEAVIKRAYGFHEAAERAVNWTREVLKPRWFSMLAKKRRWEFLSNLPLQIKEDGCLFIHGSPLNATMDYIFEADVEDSREGYSDKIQRIFEKIERLCFVGHTHTPGIVTEDPQFVSPEEGLYRYRLRPGRKYIINVGSVGQPRDRDNRACYVLFDGEQVFYRRVPYAYRGTQEKIGHVAQLSPVLGARLRFGE